MSYLLKGGTVITLDPPVVERVDLRVENGQVAARAKDLKPQAGDEVVDVRGKLLMPGLVCGHTHLYSTLARGMPGPERTPANFKEILELVWWRLDRALDREAIYYSALVGALEAARAGTTCLYDHHSSPSFIQGSLGVVSEALETIGLRGVLCYEVTDRGGQALRDEGLRETSAFLESIKLESIKQESIQLESIKRRSNDAGQVRRGSMLVRGMVGAHASFTLSDESLDACSKMMQIYDAGLHIHAAEDLCDVDDAHSKYGLGIVERLANHGLLNQRTILAHGTHLDEREIRMALDAGAWFAHNPGSNMNNQVGYAPVVQFGDRSVLGTDGIGADMFEQARLAYFKGRDAHGFNTPGDWVKTLARGQQLASESFGVDFRALAPGSAADLIVLDYNAPTPLAPDNLAGHVIFGMNSRLVNSVMVNGRFIIKNGRSGLDEEELSRKAREVATRLWRRFTELSS
jgi:putative selenium metabolism protein SsnA